MTLEQALSVAIDQMDAVGHGRPLTDHVTLAQMDAAIEKLTALRELLKSHASV